MTDDRMPWEEFSSDSPAGDEGGAPWDDFAPAAPAGGGMALVLPQDSQGKGFIGHVQDTAVSLAKGAVGVPELAVGLADIPTGGRVGKFLENEGGMVGFRPGQAKEFLSEYHTDQYQSQLDDFANADGVIEKAKVAITNPALIGNTVVESLPSMGAGGAAARGLMAGGKALGVAVNPAVAGAIGEGLAMAGAQAESTRQQTEDGLLTEKQSALAAVTGVGGALFGFAGGRLAQRLGIGDVDTMLARGVDPKQVAQELAQTPAKAIPRQIIEGAISEGLFEELPQSVSETISQNLALDKPWNEGIEDSIVMGTLAGMAMGGPAAGVNGWQQNRARKAFEQLGGIQAQQEVMDQQITEEKDSLATDEKTLKKAAAQGASLEDVMSMEQERAARLAALEQKKAEREALREREQAAKAEVDQALSEQQPASVQDQLRDDAGLPVDGGFQQATAARDVQTSDVPQSMRDVVRDWQAMGVQNADVSESGGTITVGKIEMQEGASGNPETALQHLTDYANAAGKKLVLKEAPPPTGQPPAAIPAAPETPPTGGVSASGAMPVAQPAPTEFQESGNQLAAEQQAAIDTAAHEAATSPENDLPEPTQAQKEAGNYKKGHINLQGLDITVENPRGSERSGKREDGSTWSHAMSDHYGYIKRTKGADEEQVDVYVGQQPDSDRVFVVDQLDQKTGNFDEHKAMLGFADEASAVAAYRSNFDEGWKVGPVRSMSMDEFKSWLKEGDTTQPATSEPAAVKESLTADATQGKETAPALNSATGKDSLQVQEQQPAAQEATAPQKSRYDYMAEIEARAETFGREQVEQEQREQLASMTRAPDAGESFEDYLKRNPDEAVKHDAITSWLAGKKPTTQGERIILTKKKAQAMKRLASEQATMDFDAPPQGDGWVPRLSASGQPFKTEQHASSSARQNKIPEYRVEAVDGGFAIMLPPPSANPATAGQKIIDTKKKAQAIREKRAAHFAPGNIVTSYGNARDRVLQYEDDGKGNWRVQVEAVAQQPDGSWKATGEPRWHQTELDRNDKVVEAAKPAGDVATPDAFVSAPDGSQDFGEINAEQAKALGRQAGKIRLQQGEHREDGTGYGLAHIEAKHGKQIRAAGFDSVEQFVAHIAGHVDEIWKANVGQLLEVVRSDGQHDVMYIQLQPSESGDFYRVNSAFPVRQKGYEEKRGFKPLWFRSEPGTQPSGKPAAFADPSGNEAGQTVPNARGQREDSSVDPAAAPVKQEAASDRRKVDRRLVDPTASLQDEARRALEKAGMTPEQAAKAAAAVQASTDELLGGVYYDHYLKPAIARAQKSGVPHAYYHIEMENLGGLNKVIGSAVQTDDELAALAREIRNISPDVVLFSHGGSNFGLLVPAERMALVDKELADISAEIGQRGKEIAGQHGYADIPGKGGGKDGLGLLYKGEAIDPKADPQAVINEVKKAATPDEVGGTQHVNGTQIQEHWARALGRRNARIQSGTFAYRGGEQQEGSREPGQVEGMVRQPGREAGRSLADGGGQGNRPTGRADRRGVDREKTLREASTIRRKHLEDLAFERGVEQSQLDTYARFFDKAKRDDTTGLWAKTELRPLFDDAVRVVGKGAPVQYVSVDISNLSGMNKGLALDGAASRDLADILFKAITDMTRERLEATGASVQGIRQGGDEISFFTAGVELAEIQQAMNDAKQEIADWLEVTGYSKLPHLKSYTPEVLAGTAERDTSKDGSGIYVGIADLNDRDFGKVPKLRDILERADKLVATDKEAPKPAPRTQFDPDAWKYLPVKTLDGKPLEGKETAETLPSPAAKENLAVTPDKPKPVGEKKAPAKTSQPAALIQDAGDQLVWNRKGLFKSGGLTWDSIKDSNDTLKLKMATKEKVWARPDWEAMVNAVPDDQRQAFAMVAHLVKQVYDKVPKSPSGKTDAHIEQYINAVTELREAANDLLNNKAKQQALADALAGQAAVRLGRRSGSGASMLDMVKPTTDRVAMQPLYAALFPEQAAGARFVRGTPANDKGVQLGKALGAMQFTVNSAVDALKAIDKDGWPAKREAWQKQGYSVVAGDSATAEFYESKGLGGREKYVSVRLVLDDDGRLVTALRETFAGKESQDDPAVQAWASQQLEKAKGQFAVLDKRGRMVGWSASREAAEQLARDTVRRSTNQDAEPKGDGSWERVGPERREPGENISSEQMKDAFGFRGVNFGKWVKQDERQEFLNAGYDALMDLAEVMGIPPRALSLNGMVGIAFGAQGRGGANAAHFVPGVNEINLTKTAGAGALAHEWGHALDHYFGVMAGLAKAPEPMASHLMRYGGSVKGSELRPELSAAIKAVVHTMQKVNESPSAAMQRMQDALTAASQNFERYLAGTGWRDQLKSNASAEAALKDLEAGVPLAAENYIALPPPKGKRKSPGAVYVQVKTIGDALGLDAAQMLYLHDKASSIGWAKDQLAGEVRLREIHTDYYKSSRIADKDRKKPYWSTEHEMFARAFESWVMDKLAEQEFRNDFLVRAGKGDSGTTNTDYPYPAGAERKTFNKAFDTLVGEIKVRVEKGSDGQEMPVLFNQQQDVAMPVAGIDRATAEKVVADFLKDYQGAAKLDIRIFDDKVQAYGRARLAFNKLLDARIKGAFGDGQLHLMLDAHDDAADLLRTLRHEVWAHYGMDLLTDSQKKRLRLSLGALLAESPELRSLWKNRVKRDYADAPYEVQQEELLAAVAEEYGNLVDARAKESPLVNTVRKAFNILREMLTKVGIIGKRDGLDAVVDMLADSARRMRKETAPVAGEGETRFSKQDKSNRAPWGSFPPVKTLLPLNGLKKADPVAYEQAKAGDSQAAVDLAITVLGNADISAIQQALGERKPVVVPVRAVESSGKNQIPEAMAKMLARRLGLDIDTVIYQSAMAGHTNAGAYERIVRQATFDGQVVPGQEYLIVDDTITMGGTLAALRAHIENHGGRVILGMAVTGYQRDMPLAPSNDMIKTTLAKHGKPLADWVQHEFGFPLEQFTHGELGQLRAAPSLDAIRDRLAAAGWQENKGSRGRQDGGIEDDGQQEGEVNQDLTDTPAFKRWFGDSKVVDKDGKPLVVYHGTDSNFNLFDMGKAADGAHFFTANEKHAASFGAVKPFYVSIKNPLEITQTDLEKAWDVEHPDGEQDDRYLLPRDFVAQFVEQAKQAGNDGLIVRGMADKDIDADMFLPFTPEQIKSSTSNRGTFDPANPDIRFNKVSGAGAWYKSALLDAANSIKQEKGTPEQMLAILAKTPGVKSAEIEATGLPEFLQMGGKSVTKQQIVEYLQGNGVQVQDVMLGVGNLPTLPDGWSVQYETEAGEYVVRDEDGEEINSDTTREDAIRGAMDADELSDNLDAAGETKFGKYVLPGGENYRELLLTLPYTRKNTAWGDAVYDPDGDPDYPWAIIVNGKEVNRSKSEDTVDDILQEEIDRANELAVRKETFNSSHYNHPNILAHVRFNERTDSDGKKVLFIEEIQSDWAQQGRKKGFARERYTVTTKHGTRRGVFNSQKEATDYIGQSDEKGLKLIKEAQLNRGVPSAPFVTSTDAWVSLAMKRMIAYAAENGFDRVAWTTGEQQSDRYDLSKQVDTIEWAASHSDKYSVTAIRNGGTLAAKDRVTAEELEAFIGKDAAKKIVEAKESGQLHGELKGLELRVGDQGMRSFYDNIVPKVAKDVLKKLGGGPLGIVKIGTNGPLVFRPASDGGVYRERSESAQPGFDITPAIREAVAGGLPLFNKQQTTGSAAISLMKASKKARAIDKRTLQVALDNELRKLYQHGLRLKIHSTFDDLPVDAQGETGAAVIRIGKVIHVVADRLENAKSVRRVLRRELTRLRGGGFDPKAFAADMGDAMQSAPAIGAVKQDLLKTWESVKDGRLAFLTRRHLADVGRRYLPALQRYVDAAQQMDADRNDLLAESARLADVWRRFDQLDKTAGDALANLMHDATIAGVDPDVPYTPLMTTEEAKAQHKMLDERARGLSGDSKMIARIIQKKEAVDQLLAQEINRAKVAPDLKKRWDALPPAAQEIYRAVRDQYKQRNELMLKYLEDRIEHEVENREQRKVMIDRLRQQFESNKVQEPYFPLQRFGRYWVAEKGADGETASFVMFETEGEWAEYRDALKRTGVRIKSGKQIEQAFRDRRVDPGFVTDVDELLKDLPETMADSLRDQVYQLYLQTLPNLSARKHFIHRKATAGFSRDAIRAFSKNSFHGGYQLARLKWAHRLERILRDADEAVRVAGDDDALDALEEQVLEGNADPELLLDAEAATKDVAKASDLLGELHKRHEWAMNPKGGWLANKLSGIGFGWYLGLTPAAALVNLTQVPLVAFPTMGSRFGFAQAGTELTRAYRDYLKGGAGKEAFFSIGKSLDGDELDAYNEFVRRGVIDKTLAHDLAGMAEEGSDYSETWHKVMSVLSWGFHKAEVQNREVTALASYRLARKAGLSHGEAIEVGADITWESQFDYSSGNKARFMQSDTAKVVLMFRQYALNMTYMLYRTGYQALKNERPEIRHAAQKKLGAILFMHGLAAGALGMLPEPIYPLLKAVIESIGGDDDEPYDLETEVRILFAELFGDTGGRALARGLGNAAGIDLSGRISLTNLWVRSSDRELEGKDAWHFYTDQLLGPIGGIAAGFFNGAKLMNDGQYVRGLEMMMPKALRDGVKTVRYATDGATTLRGDALVDDMAGFELFAQAIGFTPARLADQYAENSAKMGYQQHIEKRKRDLVDRYALALRLGDNEMRQETMAMIEAYNQKNPAMAITGDAIARSMRERARYSAQSDSGIRTNKRLRGDLERIDFAGD